MKRSQIVDLIRTWQLTWWRQNLDLHAIGHRKSCVDTVKCVVCSFSFVSELVLSFLHTHKRGWQDLSSVTILTSLTLWCVLNWLHNFSGLFYELMMIEVCDIKFKLSNLLHLHVRCKFKSGKTCLWLTDWLSEVLRKMNHGVWTAHNDWVNGNYLSSSSRWWLSWR